MIEAVVINTERLIMAREFYVVIERDEDGMYIGEIPQIKACYSQGRTIDELMENMREVLELCLEDLEEDHFEEFVGVQKITV